MALTKLNNQSLTAVSALPAAITTGSVLQVQQNLINSQITVSSNGTWVQVITCNITPKFNNSKIIVGFSSGGICNGTNDVGLKVVRTIGASDTDILVRSRHGYSSGGNWMPVPFEAKYMDSPSTTSQITYQILARKNTGNLEVGSTGNATDVNRTVLMLMEIAG